MAPSRTTSLALDHITTVDCTPSQLVETASAAGCRAVCAFLTPMSVLPDMPPFELHPGSDELRATKARMEDLSIGLDIAYPFTLASRTEIESLRPLLECAAGLNAWSVNVLNYDRDPARRLDQFSRFCELAAGEYGLNVVLEFFPASQVKTLAQALELVTQVGRPGQVGVNVDLLHLVRSGGSIADLRAAPPEYILYGQFCDAPAACADERRDFEASSQRMLAGSGELDVAGFASALPECCRASVEIPRHDALAAGVSAVERARQAVASVESVLASGAARQG